MAIEHKPLIEYLPPFLAEYREYRRLFSVLWDEISEDDTSILNRTEAALNNTFAALADEDGIKHWERMLSIVPSVEATLNDRREIIRMKLVGDRPYTFRKLGELLDKLLGAGQYVMEMTGTFELALQVELTSRFQYAAAVDLLNKIVPANIDCTVSLRYNQHQKYSGIYTHNQMAEYTHAELKEAIL